MIDINEVKIGTIFILNSDPYEVLFREHSKTGRGGAVLRTKIKNLRTGALREETFKGGDKFEEAKISVQKFQFLYQDDKECNFMNNETYEQLVIDKNKIGDKAAYFKEGMDVEIVFFENNPLDVRIPIKINFKVVESPPNVKGNTASGADKVVTLENGLQVTVPMFIKEGDVVKINTERGEYAERA